MKPFKLFTFFFIFSLNLNAQCYEKLGEAQDTTSIYHAIGQDGLLYEISPSSVPMNPIVLYPNVTDWQRIFTGTIGLYHLALKTDSTLWEFDNGTNLNQIGTSKWKDISFMWGANCGIKSDGTLWRWGAGINTMEQIGVENDWKDIEVLTYWFNNWSSVRIAGIKNDGSLWVYDYANPTPQWVQYGNSMQWDFIDMTMGSGENALYAINTTGDLHKWINFSNSSVIVGVGPWKEISCTANLYYKTALKVDGSVYFWSAFNQLPTQLQSNILVDEINLGSDFGPMALKSGSLYFYENDYFNNTFTAPTIIGNPCCVNIDISLTLSGCVPYSWNNQILDSTGIYVASLTNVNGCDSLVTLNFNANTTPEEPIITFQNDSTLNVDLQQNCTYQWVVCPSSTPIANATSNSYTVVNDGEYAVIVSNSCGYDTSNCMIVSLAQTEDLGTNMLRIYPNPTSHDLNIEYAGEINKIELLDLNGKLIFSDNQSLSLYELPNSILDGVYLLSVYTADKIICEKLIIRH
jgi:hypothetical protein